MARSMYKRFVITIPGHLAAKSREPQYATLTGKDESVGNPFYGLGEWYLKTDCIYDTLR